MHVWDAPQYLKFSAERNQAIFDLVARLSAPPFCPDRIVDLGCGPANSTSILASRWPEAAITGVDRSEEMLAAARKALPQAAFTVDDIRQWAARPSSAATRYGLVFSNSALQWVADLAVLVPNLFRHVAAGGALGFQIPASTDVPAATIPRELAASAAWRERFIRHLPQWHTEPLAFFYDRLAPLAHAIEMWETEYVHLMADAEAILEWYKGSGLRPFLQALASEADRERFCAACLQGFRAAYRPQPDGRVLFPFRRRFVIAWAE